MSGERSPGDLRPRAPRKVSGEREKLNLGAVERQSSPAFRGLEDVDTTDSYRVHHTALTICRVTCPPHSLPPLYRYPPRYELRAKTHTRQLVHTSAGLKAALLGRAGAVVAIVQERVAERVGLESLARSGVA